MPSTAGWRKANCEPALTGSCRSPRPPKPIACRKKAPFRRAARWPARSCSSRRTLSLTCERRSHPQIRALRLIGKNRLQRAPARGFDLCPTGARQGGEFRPAGRRDLALALRGPALPFLIAAQRAFCAARILAIPAALIFLRFRFPVATTGAGAEAPSNSPSVLLQGINPLFEVCCPPQLLRCKICECFHIGLITLVPT